MPFIRHPNGGETMNGRTNTTGQVLMGLFIPLEPISDLNLVPRDSKCLIQWTDPVDKYTTPGDELVAQWQYTIVVRKENSAPTGPTDGVLVVKETTRNQYAEIAYEDTGLNNGTTYYYALYAYTIMNVANEAVIDDALIRAAKPVFLQELYVGRDTGGHTWGTGTSISATSNHLLIAGGDPRTNTVDAYNSDLTKESVSTLHASIFSPGAGKLNGYAIFAGGSLGAESFDSGPPDSSDDCTNRVTAYDTNLTKISMTNLTSAFWNIKNASSSNILYFFYDGKADGYDITGTRYSISDLTGITLDASCTSAGNYAIAVGFFPSDSKYGYAFDDTHTMINISNNIPGASNMGATTLDSNGIFAGGDTNQADVYVSYYSDIHRMDENLTRSTVGTLNRAGRRGIPSAEMSVGNGGRFAVFVGGYNTNINDHPGFEIYGGSCMAIAECLDILFTKQQIDSYPSTANFGSAAYQTQGDSAASIGNIAFFGAGANLTSDKSIYGTFNYTAVFKME